MELNSEPHYSNSFDFKSLVKIYTKKWKWFVFSLVCFILGAYLFIRYSQPQFAVEARIKVLEENSASPELNAFQDLPVFSGSVTAGAIEDEIQSFKSRSNLIEVVEELKLNIKIENLGKILSSEIYKEAPFKLNFIASDSIIRSSNFQFILNILSENTFGYAISEDHPVRVYAFGSNIPSSTGDIVITPNTSNIKSSIGKRYKISVTAVADVAQQYQYLMTVMPLEKSSNILSIYLNDPIAQKAKDIINTLIKVYNKNAVLDKKIIADKTSKFIDDRIANISSDLSTVDQTAQDFKTGKGITDIASEASMNLNLGATNRQELIATTTELQIAQSMKDIVDNTEEYVALPSNIGLSDATISSTTTRYNELVSERNRLLKSSNEQNPIIVNLNQQLDGLRNNMRTSLNSVTNNLSLQANSLSGQLSRINSKIYSVPKNERTLKDISREQNTIESLYLYLLQKREESQIAYASAAPKLKIVDEAFSYGSSPVSPNKKSIYLVATLLGLLLPFSFIYVGNLLDTKIHNKSELEKIVFGTPVLAELPILTRKEQKNVINDDRSVLAESLRIFRTNLDYLIKTKKDSAKNNNIIYITSSVAGEGKTFISSNLSMIFARTNKKVLLIGADIRNPKLNFFFNKNKKEIDLIGSKSTDNNLGLTEYLSDSTLTSKDVIVSLLVHSNTIDVIHSGKTPPNPAEILMSKRYELLLNEVSNAYDYVIVDTAPMIGVSDTLVITQFADHVIYATRAGITDKGVVEFPLQLKREGKLKNLSFVVNGVKEANLGYKGAYGYGYGRAEKKWWKFWA